MGKRRSPIFVTLTSLQNIVSSARTSTFDLIARGKHGDQQAFDRLFQKYRRRLAVLIHYKLGMQLRATLEVDDILQETLMRAFLDLERFNYMGQDSFMTWLSTIASHVIADAARSRGRQRRQAQLVRLRSASNPAGPEPADRLTPSKILSRQENIAAIVAKLDRLPEAYREAILMAKMEGLSRTEIAERLGKTPEQAALLVHRAVKRLTELEKERE